MSRHPNPAAIPDLFTTHLDPSALARLYIHAAGSREMAAWRAKIGGALTVTHHGRTEIVNAICRVAFLRHLN